MQISVYNNIAYSKAWKYEAEGTVLLHGYRCSGGFVVGGLCGECFVCTPHDSGAECSGRMQK